MALDYTNFGATGPIDRAGPTDVGLQWWKLSGEEIAQSVTAIVKFLHHHQSRRLTQHIMSARLYGNVSLMGLSGLSKSRVTAALSGMKDRISYNVVQSAIDAVTAKLGKNKPKPLFLTSGGSFKMQRKAKKLNQFVDGIFYENNAYALGIRTFVDGCIFDTGAVHVYSCDGRVRFERVLTSELYVDEIEAFYGEPRQMHRIKNVDRAVLMDAFPNKRNVIATVNRAQVDDAGATPNVSDLVAVRESWHLPSGKDAKDGRHTITTDTAVLYDEPWERDDFPFAFFRWSPRQYGFWGQSLAEQVQNIQLEINKLLWVIQRSLHLGGSYKILIENGSKIVTEHLTNDIGAAIRYTGTKPEYIVPPMVAPEVYQHLLTLKNAAFEQAGISQLSASSQKPAGLNSGKALREYNDIESDRFSVVGKAYEQFFLDLAKLAITTVKELAEEEGNYQVNVPGKKFLSTVDWKDIDLDEDEYVMQCYPVSSLPNDPAGRLQTIQEYMQAGLISPRQGKRLLDFPDLEQIESLQNAAEEYLSKILDGIVDDGEYTPPEPFDDLQMAREMALEYYAQGKTRDLEPERLEMLRTFMSQLDVLEQSAAQAMAPPPGAAMPGAPQAPAAPPQPSDLVPNAPGIPGIQ